MAEKINFRLSRVRFCLAIPKLKALHNAVASQRDGARPSALADYVADLECLGLAIAIVDYDVVELNGCVVNPDLQEAIAACRLSNFNIVMVVPAIDVGFAKKYPLFSVRHWRNIEHQG